MVDYRTKSLQATPGLAFVFSFAKRPGAPELLRSA